MKHIIIGAGATFVEAKNLGVSEENLPPLMNDFAKKTWENYTPHPLLEIYLKEELGHINLGHDPRKLFFKLEEEGKTNIEVFMEFVWNNRNRDLSNDIAESDLPLGYISGLRCTSVGKKSVGLFPSETDFWQNLLYHGLGNPISFIMIQCFFENGKGWKDFAISKSIASFLEKGDLVLNLNYDTVFELALEQAGISFFYTPNSKENAIEVCKPHGSLNLVSNNEGFTFGQPTWLGVPEPPNFSSYSGLIPPRLNKSYEQNPIAKTMLYKIQHRKPKHMIFWGIGMTESDADLLDVYKKWVVYADIIDVINPSYDAKIKIEQLLECKVNHFKSHEEWIEQQKLN